MASENYDSARTKLFQQAQFNGSFVRRNVVKARISRADYLTPYNVVYRDAHSMFVYGGGFGDKGGTGAFVARVDPSTLRTVWSNQLIDTTTTNEWDYPGVVAILRDGSLYVIYGYRLAKLDPSNGHVLGQVVLPTPAAPRDTSYNGFDALPDGTLIAKAIYRQAGCEEQGFSAFTLCPNPTDIPNSIIVAINPRTLRVIAQTLAPQPIGGRLTAVRFKGKDYIYVAGSSKIYRYRYAGGHISPDRTWGPVRYLNPRSGQTNASAVVVMNDWVVFADNGTPVTDRSAPSPWMSVFAVNQADASKKFAIQPFKAFRSGPRYPVSFSPSAVSVDLARNEIFVLDAGPGRIVDLQLRSDGLHTVWTKRQRTTEFLALIGPPARRVLVGTDIPFGQPLGTNRTDEVVWRVAATGRELARSRPLPAILNGTMVQPGYGGRMYYLQLDKLIELTVSPRSAAAASSSPTTNPVLIKKLATKAYVWGLAPEFIYRFLKYNTLVTAPLNTFGGGSAAAAWNNNATNAGDASVLYLNAMIDLSGRRGRGGTKELVLTVPPSNTSYYVVNLLDDFINTVGGVGTRTTPSTRAQTYLIVGPTSRYAHKRVVRIHGFTYRVMPYDTNLGWIL
ncbi:MAG: DUF1254 domain-containing protein, partial [Solirubrobacterales bacterium]|nr:DUF1254 domain-containing protein [Solirubrobacterales bacterium]